MSKKVKQFAKEMSDKLKDDYWGDIDPRYFQLIGEGVDTSDREEVSEEAAESIDSLVEAIEAGLKAIGVKI